MTHLFDHLHGVRWVGFESDIKGFSASFLGIATRDEAAFARAAHLLDAMAQDTPDGLGVQERRLNLAYHIVHSFRPTPARVLALPDLLDVVATPHLLRRLTQLWHFDAVQAANAAYYEQQATNWQSAWRDANAAIKPPQQDIATLAARAYWKGQAEAWEREYRAASKAQATAAHQAETLKSALREAEAAHAEAQATIAQLQSGQAITEGLVHAACQELAALQHHYNLLLQIHNAVISSEAWRMTRPLRRLGARMPLLAVVARRVTKLVWWTVTLQLPARLRGRGQAPMVGAAPLSAPEPDLGLPAESAAQPPGAEALRGGFALMASSARNLMAQRVPLVQGGRLIGVERFTPLPDTPSVPLVTIIIPCFNDGRYVREALDSALAQTFRDIEVIVVDGGSTDGTTPAIVAALEGPRVRALIRTDGRHLPGDNRNFGIAASTSRYVCCLDSDDILDPTYIEKMLFQLEYRAGDVASSSMRKFGAGTGEWRLPERPTFDDFLLGNQALVCSVFRRALWQAASGFHDSGLGADHAAEDWDFWLRLAGLGARFRNLQGETLMHYRVHDHGQSVSSQSGMRSLAVQGMLIQSRNRALITDDTRSLSHHQAARQIYPLHDRLPMRLAMRRAADAAPLPTLLLAIPFFLVGGAERLLSAVVGGLVASGWRVVVVSTEFEPLEGGDSLPWFTAHTAECYALPRFLPPEDWQDFVGYLIGSRQPDALMIAGSRFFYDMLPKLAEQYPAMARLDLLFNIEGHVAKHLEHRANLTGALCESLPVLAWLKQQAGWSDAALACIPSGVDTIAHSPGPRPAELVAQMGIAPDDIVVGWSGRLSEEKAPEIFLDLAARCMDLPGVHFVMTGGGPMKPCIAQAASRLPAGTRLHLFGLVDDIRAFYRLYDIYTLTSRIDGRPLAVMEAQASGCAVLASRIGGVPDIMADGVTGLLANPAEAADFERALRHMVADRAGLAAMRAQARALAVDRFSVTAMVEGYRRALEDAVAAARIDPPAATR